MKTHVQLLVNKLMSIIEPLTLISLGFLKIVFSGGTKEIFISSDRLEEFKGNFQIIKSHKKQGFTPSLERTVLEKPQGAGGGGGQIDLLTFLGLKSHLLKCIFDLRTNIIERK